MVEDLTSFDFEHEFLSLFLDSFGDGIRSCFLAFDEDNGVERLALGQSGQVDLFLFLFGRHPISYIYITISHPNTKDKNIDS